MEIPLVQAGFQEDRTRKAFELLARAGVDSLRTAELCWHRLARGGADAFDFSNIDYQVAEGSKYGMNFMFTIGYPPGRFNREKFHLSTFRDEYEPQFREYLETVFMKYGAHAQYWEYANEVDAPKVWWRGATPEDYVRDCRIVREEMEAAGIGTPLLGISATYSRNDSRDHKGEGRAFTRKLLAAGLEKYVDGYSLHYAWRMKDRDYVRFFRELSPGRQSARLVNSEESGFTHPSDLIKLTARNLYLHGMESVYYYLARDRMEGASLNRSGLFDIDWRPKLRLLSLAVAADAMKTRNLVGMAEPAPGVEAYVLDGAGTSGDGAERFAVVLWKNGGGEEVGTKFTAVAPPAPETVRFPARGVKRAVAWNLDEVVFDAERPAFAVGAWPMAVYCGMKPDWQYLTPEAWLATHGDPGVSQSDAVVPQQP